MKTEPESKYPDEDQLKEIGWTDVNPRPWYAAIPTVLDNIALVLIAIVIFMLGCTFVLVAFPVFARLVWREARDMWHTPIGRTILIVVFAAFGWYAARWRKAISN